MTIGLKGLPDRAYRNHEGIIGSITEGFGILRNHKDSFPFRFRGWHRLSIERALLV